VFLYAVVNYLFPDTNKNTVLNKIFRQVDVTLFRGLRVRKSFRRRAVGKTYEVFVNLSRVTDEV
jgi:hypothetical protein